ncbi:MAG: hypothetical protein ACXADL_13275 [Candidatus Thorarchaeota archaeon]|jgi:hypothetical protein
MRNNKKQQIAARLFAKRKRVSNREVSEALGIGFIYTEEYMKPLGFVQKWESERDVRGQEYQVKVWINN